jgi:UDP:flavonoid glycosyltransferase YjiC (YdhE family)
MSSDYYRAAVEACQVLGRPGLLVTQHEALIPQRLPKEVHWFNYLSFAEVMPRSAAVIHHGGIGTIGQAFASGIPQVALASGNDRPYNAMCLERTGVGVFLPPPRWQSETIALALQQLITSPQVQKHCQALAQRIQASDPLASACKVIESLLVSQPGSPVPSSPPEPPQKARAISDRLNRLSPEKRALLEQRLKEFPKE